MIGYDEMQSVSFKESGEERDSSEVETREIEPHTILFMQQLRQAISREGLS